MTAKESLGKAELELLQLVEKLQPAAVRTLVEHLAESSGLARTTVITMLERLRRKGFLTRRKIQGMNHYSPRVSVPALMQRLVGDFIQKMLGGSVSPVVAYLQDANTINATELAELKQLVQQLEDQQATKGAK